jgi:hypothetical protein
MEVEPILTRIHGFAGAPEQRTINLVYWSEVLDS